MHHCQPESTSLYKRNVKWSAQQLSKGLSTLFWLTLIIQSIDVSATASSSRYFDPVIHLAETKRTLDSDQEALESKRRRWGRYRSPPLRHAQLHQGGHSRRCSQSPGTRTQSTSFSWILRCSNSVRGDSENIREVYVTENGHYPSNVYCCNP